MGNGLPGFILLDELPGHLRLLGERLRAAKMLTRAISSASSFLFYRKLASEAFQENFRLKYKF